MSGVSGLFGAPRYDVSVSDDSWFVRQLRSRAVGAADAQSAFARASGRLRRPGGTDAGGPERPWRLVVCGGDHLALRLIEELIGRYSAEVTAVLPNRRGDLGPRIARLPGVRVVESVRLDAETFRQARLAQADALALVRQDDVGNIHAALQAQEINPQIRIVVRMFNLRLGHGVRRMFRDCVVLSDAAMAAPTFVSAALGEVAPAHVRLRGRTLYVTRRDEVAPADVVCGLACVDNGSGRLEVLPGDPARADLVLAVANGGQIGSLVPNALVDAGVDPGVVAAARTTIDTALSGDGEVLPRWRLLVRRRWRPLAWIRRFVNPKLRNAVLALVGVLAAGTVVLAVMRHDLGLGNAAYLTVLTALGGVNPDVSASIPVKIVQALVALASIAFVPVVTAAVVEAVVHARLSAAQGRLRRPIRDHVVVIGLGDVGTRVARQLHALGVPLVAVDRNAQARGVAMARSLGIPFVLGDASREETLHEASVQTCRALVCLSTDDVTNLEAALYAQGLKGDLRVVLRLFDGDFADRVQRAFGMAISRSVSYVAAPDFAVAMVERRVIGTLPINRRVLLVGEVPVGGGSPLDGRTVAHANLVGQARVVALNRAGGRDTIWAPADSQVLGADDVLTVVATRTGLAHMRVEAGDSLASRDLARGASADLSRRAAPDGARGAAPDGVRGTSPGRA